MSNDAQIFILVPREEVAAARHLIGAAFGADSEQAVDFTARWSADGGVSHTHNACAFPASSDLVTRERVQQVYRARYPDEVTPGEADVMRGDYFVTRYEAASGHVIAAILVTKIRAEQGWVSVHAVRDWSQEFGCVPYVDTPPI